jgi:beta-lactamase regulating signal transducer with metallopeptidase domain
MGRLSPVVRHALWLLVLIKFVTPPLVAWPWAAPDPLGLASWHDEQHRALERDAREDPPQALFVDSSVTETLAIRGTRSPLSGGPQLTMDRAGSNRMAALAWPWLLGIWLAGGLCLSLIEAVRWARLKRRMAHSSQGDPAIVARVEAWSAAMGLARVRVLTWPDSGSPFVWGVGRPTLFWPEALAANSGEPLTDACLDGLIVHELAHLKRRDHLVGWIELAAGVLWWWNPLFWFVRAELREQAELACDAWVISAVPHGRRAYAESLLALSVLEVPGTPAMPTLAARARNRRLLERRLVMIMKGQSPLRLSATGVLAIALLAGATLPTWASGSQTSARPVIAAISPLPPAPSVSVTMAPVDIGVGEPSPRQTTPPPPPPPPQPSKRMVWKVKGAPLPADGEQLVNAFNDDMDRLRRELAEKTAARRNALVESLQALQDKYTKAGQLDEALQVREYLRWYQGKATKEDVVIKKSAGTIKRQ